MKSSVPLLDERLRTMLMLRAYNCRPRHWTLKEQFDAIAEDGMLTKENLWEALRLSDYPRIDTLVDYRLFHSGVTGKPSVGSISVTDFIAFLDSGNSRYLLENANIASCRYLPSTPFRHIPLGTTSRMRLPGSIVSPITAAVPHCSAMEADEKQTNNAGGNLRYPNVVPITSRSTLSAATAAVAKRGDTFVTVTKNRGGKGEGIKQCRQSSESVSEASSSIGREHTAAVSETTPCREIVKHVSGLRGKDGCRQKPVWRKKETLVQERVVQYTTLDEKGTLQDLVETEKSQTEVLHMECKRTGEFAHRERTYYESGESFNGEVVTEESGAEHYVHFRSVDDEYEFLESTLPPRARHGDTAAAGNTGEGISEGGDDVVRAVARGATKDPAGMEEEGTGEGGTHRRGAGSSSDGRNIKGDTADVGLSARGDSGVTDNAYPNENLSVNLEGGDDGIVDDINFAAGWGGRVESGGEVADDDQEHRTPFSPSAYHYRSPVCSPRLSPSPTRSPYRQEGVGRRETTERGNHGRSWGQGRRSELPTEMDTDAQEESIALEEEESYLARLIRGEELEFSTECFVQQQKQHTIETQRLCAPGWPSVGHIPRTFADQERSPTHERKTNDGDLTSLGCDSIDELFAPIEVRAEPGPPWAPLRDDTVVSMIDNDDSEAMKRDRLFSGSGSGRDVCVLTETCLDGHDGDAEDYVCAGLNSDRNGCRQGEDNTVFLRELEYSSSGGDRGAFAEDMT